MRWVAIGWKRKGGRMARGREDRRVGKEEMMKQMNVHASFVCQYSSHRKA